MRRTASPGVQCAPPCDTRSSWVLAMSVVLPRQCACFSVTWTAVVLLALCSTAIGGVGFENGGWLCISPGCRNRIDPSYKADVTRVRRSIDDNDISQDADVVHWKPGDLDIVSDKLSIFKAKEGKYKKDEEVKLESNNADGALESSTYTVGLEPQGSKNIANEQKVVYSYPYVVFRRISDGKKEPSNEDVIYKQGTEYVVVLNSDEHSDHLGVSKPENINSHSVSDKNESEDIFRTILDAFFKSITVTPKKEATQEKRSDVNDMSDAMKIGLAITKELFSTSNKKHKNIDSIPSEPKTSGTLLNGWYGNYRTPVGWTWNTWERQSTPGSAEEISIFEKLLSNIISGLLEESVAQKSTTTSSSLSRCPFAGKECLSSQSSADIVFPELLWLFTTVP